LCLYLYFGSLGGYVFWDSISPTLNIGFSSFYDFLTGFWKGNNANVVDLLTDNPQDIQLFDTRAETPTSPDASESLLNSYDDFFQSPGSSSPESAVSNPTQATVSLPNVVDSDT